MDIWNIRGGSRLEGACKVQGSKNASLPIIAASLISPAQTELMNVPQLRDVDSALRILRHLGCSAQQQDGELYIDSRGISANNIPHSLMLEMRSSVIFMGALLARCGEARLSLPGGCQLGKRPIDIHISALRQMGAEIEEDGSNISCRANKLKGCVLELPFPSVGATENIMLTATAAEGETVIKGAAREPEIEALAEYLRRMGCYVAGDGSDTIRISRHRNLDYVNYMVIPDRIAAATVKRVKQKYPDITLMLVLPYHPAERPTEAPAGFDGTYHPEGLENTPRRYAIVRTNIIMVDTCDWLVCYVCHGASNSRNLLEYARRREEKGLIRIVNIWERETGIG